LAKPVTSGDILGKSFHKINRLRKNFTPTEAADIAEALKERETEEARKRRGTRTDLERGAKFAPSEKGEAREK